MFISFAITTVIYVLVAVAVIGTTSMSIIAGTSGDVLSVVAQGFLGKFGFSSLAVAALLSTASAVNATLFGSANIAYQVAKDGELPVASFVAGFALEWAYRRATGRSFRGIQSTE